MFDASLLLEHVTLTSVRNVNPSQATLKKVKEWLESGKDVRFGDWNMDEVRAACGTSRTAC